METVQAPPAIDRPTKRIMLAMARELWSSQLIGGAPPVTIGRYERMKQPRPGDLVVELSTAYALTSNLDDDRWDGQFVTYSHDETVTHSYDDGGTWTETASVCVNPDGTTFRWTNATLIAVPPFA